MITGQILVRILAGAVAVLLILLGLSVMYAMSLRNDITKLKLAHKTELSQAQQTHIKELEEVRFKEQVAVGKLAAIETKQLEGETRVKKLEADLAGALARGERRVHPSLCATKPATVPKATTAPGRPDVAADDGSRRVGAAVAAAARCDNQVRGLQEVIRSYIETTNGR